LDEPTFTCPRCFFTAPLASATRFCPRCGLPDVKQAAGDTAPLDVTSAGVTYRVEERLALGTLCNVYRCRFPSAAGEVQGVFKVARDARANAALANEADILRRLHHADPTGRATPFLPAFHASLALGDGPGAPPRSANVLCNHPEIRSPYELYSLAEVRAEYSSGIDPRDMAWIWRRLLSILSFTHASGVVHGAVLPPHVLIEPIGHKLVLVDWCWAVHRPSAGGRALDIPGCYDPWYRREAPSLRNPAPSLDVALSARCMIELTGGDPIAGRLAPNADPALGRYFERCLDGPRASAAHLLADFDQLIEVLWGRRTFRPFHMPPKTSPNRKGD